MINHIEHIETIIGQESGPFWFYDYSIVSKQVEKLQKFDVIRYAQKANSNINLLKYLKSLGVKIDAVSKGELERALYAGFSNKNEDEIVFTADIIEEETIHLVNKFNIPVNIGSIDMLQQLGEISPNHRIWLRINPGFGDGHSHKTNTGGKLSKHGIWYEDIPKALNIIKKYDFNLIGIHVHIGSGASFLKLSEVADQLVNIIIANKIDIPAISAGGGLSIPYKDTDQSVDCGLYFDSWNLARQKLENHLSHSVKLEIEPGRFIVAESGYLVAKVFVKKTMSDKKFILVNAGFNDLMRPVLYNGFHKISVLPNNKEVNDDFKDNVIVAGPLCESGDVFTLDTTGKPIEISLPKVEVGDYLVFHDVGAYGASMSSNYNSRPLLPEYMILNNKVTQIRKRQTIEELIQLENI